MELSKIYKDLVRESCLFRTFNRMAFLPAAICFLIALPFILVYIAGLLVYGSILILFRLLNAPTDYIHAFLKSEGKDVQHITQAVIYAIGFPAIFALKFLTGFLVFILFIVHMLVSIVGFVATLGGITFAPFLLDPVDRTVERDESEYSQVPLTCFIALGLVLLVLSLAFAPIANAINERPDDGYDRFMSHMKSTQSIDPEIYRQFYSDYTSGVINRDNYRTYYYKYYGTFPSFSNTASLDRLENQMVISKIDTGLDITYFVFTLLFSALFFRSKPEPEGSDDEED